MNHRSAAEDLHFAANLEQHGDQVAVLDECGVPHSYRELARRADQMAESFAQPHTLVLIRCAPALSTLIAYLACLRQHRVAMLVDGDLDQGFLKEIIATYFPETLVDPAGEVTRVKNQAPPVRPDLAVLMTTSGSTGTPKMVMLSVGNLQANAASICRYLPIDGDERAITSLPLHYSYGLSVINTHLLVGGRLSMSASPVVSREFWERFRQDEITSLAGVPYFYEMLKKLRFDRMTLPSLRYLTQAGGCLDPSLVTEFGIFAQSRGLPFFVMYGQTEATARIAYMPPEQLLQRPGSIGIAIPDGELRLRYPSDKEWLEEPEVEGELIYRGPNVMLGYACRRADLYGDNKLQELATGDLARRDADGFFRITGRLKRFIKLFGQRVSLDEIERRLHSAGHEVLCAGRDQELIIGCLDATPPGVLKTWVKERLGIHPSVITVHHLPERPLTAAGKIHYGALLEIGR